MNFLFFLFFFSQILRRLTRNAWSEKERELNELKRMKFIEKIKIRSFCSDDHQNMLLNFGELLPSPVPFLSSSNLRPFFFFVCFILGKRIVFTKYSIAFLDE